MIPERESLPKVTFILVSYEQEKYVRESVEAALAQSYEPLEIILSDDASSDSTYSIIEKTVSAYTGSHQVILNQNIKNLGIGGHINKLMRMATGELVVLAAGDDIAHPNRVEVLVQKWLAADKPACISSAAIEVGASGKPLNREGYVDPQRVMKKNLESLQQGDLAVYLLSDERYWVRGSTAAWSKEMWDFFGPMEEGCDFEDQAFSFRAFLMGKIELINDELIDYRIHDESMLSTIEAASLAQTKLKLQKRARMQKKSAATYQSHLNDLDRWAGHSSYQPELAVQLREKFSEKKKAALIQSVWWEMDFWERVKEVRRAEVVHSYDFRALAIFGLNFYSAYFFGTASVLDSIKRFLR